MMNTGEIKFRPIRKGNLSGWVLADSPVDLFKSAALFRENKVRICKEGSKITAAVTEDVFVKCYFYHSFFSRLRHKFCLSRAKNSVYAALAILKAGVPTPAPLGVLRESGVFLPAKDYLFTDLLSEKHILMHRFLRKYPEEGIEKLTDCVCKLHAGGIEHGDLSLRNLYMADNGETGVIDLDGCTLFNAPLSRRIRIREAARVISSAPKVCSTFSLDEFQKKFLELYQKRSGIDLAGSELDSRVDYLYNRRRT